MNPGIFFFSFLFIFTSSPGFAMENPNEEFQESSSSTSMQDHFSDLELGSISDYEEETLAAANEGFYHWEEREYNQAEDYLKKAAENRHSYSMPKYALILLDSDHLLQSKQMKEDIFQAADLMLMAALRGEEMASDYVTKLDKTVKKITVQADENTEETSFSIGLLETIKGASAKEIKKWLKGKFPSRKDYPNEIQDALKLFFLSVLPKLENELFNKTTQIVAKEIRSIGSEKKQKLVGKQAVDIHNYASEILKLRTEISETPSYSGDSQSQRKGQHNYTYYNTRNKYPYDLDVCMRTLNCSLSNPILETEGRFVRTQAEPMAAGPVYDGLRRWDPPSKKPKGLPGATAFVVDSFYRDFSEIFYGNPLWLIEMTHMEDPWKNINNLVETQYDKKWPCTEGIWNKYDPECKKRAFLKKTYQDEIENYSHSEKAKESIAYRLFLLSLKDQMNKSVILTDDKKTIEIDLRYISKERLNTHEEDISRAETLILNYGTSSKITWIKDLLKNNIQCTTIKYSLDERNKNINFENYLCNLRRDSGISIENLKGKTPSLSSETPKAAKKQKKEKEALSLKSSSKEKKKSSSKEEKRE